jgi:hypothetical protein
MKPLTIQQIKHATGGKAVTSIPPTAPPISAVCTDTRRMTPGSLFVALRGDRHNAHEFLPDAAAGGAVAALVEQVPAQTLPNVYLIKVEDTKQAMGKLATYVRRHMRSKVIAVAGSNGKTSTKYLIDAALSFRLRGSMSPKSFNNDIGVPLTIFPADPMQDYLVLEMGTNHHGEVKVLTEMALPDIAVITNCGAEHLEFLGDLMGVRRENASVIAGLNARGGLLVVNGDDPELLSAVSPFKGKRITFGFRADERLVRQRRALRRGRHAVLPEQLEARSVRADARQALGAEHAGGHRGRAAHGPQGRRDHHRAGRGARAGDAAPVAGVQWDFAAERRVQRQPEFDARRAGDGGGASGQHPPRRGAWRHARAGEIERAISQGSG